MSIPAPSSWSRYFLSCTECQTIFPHELFEGQYSEFRMCSECKLKNPEIIGYLYDYEYLPKWANTWVPFDERLDKLAKEVEDLEAEVEDYKKTYCKDKDDTAIDRLDGLLETCKDIQMNLQPGNSKEKKK